MACSLDDELYDRILDALDNEDVTTLVELFTTHGLSPNNHLNDSPREGFNDQILYTYIDYVLSYNLTTVLEYLIDENGLEVSDDLLARTLDLNLDSYEYLITNGYIPQISSLRVAVRNALSGIVDSILAMDCELVMELVDADIEYLFSFDMDEETIETIRVLFNYNINPLLFRRFLKALKDPEDKYFAVSEEETDIAIEIIEFLESNGVTADYNCEEDGHLSDSYNNSVPNDDY
jgi:hypothetical protein